MFIGKPMKTPDDKASGSREGAKRIEEEKLCTSLGEVLVIPKLPQNQQMMLDQNVLWLLHTQRLCTR